jgi:hypothetical protein
MVSIEEIDNRIAELHNKGKGTREISANVHKNFSYVGARLKILFPEEYFDTITTRNETEALRMFSERKKPTEVAIKLQWNFAETKKVYLDYLRLERLYELYRIYDEHEADLRLFLYFYKQLAKRKFTSRKDFDDVLKIIDTNNAFGEEIKEFDTIFPPKLLRVKFPNRVFDPVDNGETYLPVKDFYTLDDLERAFYE